MGILDVLRISSSGMKAQRTRMEAIATNLANVHTTRTEKGGLQEEGGRFCARGRLGQQPFRRTLQQKMEGVKVEEVVDSQKPFERTYDPFHPHADADGYVTFPTSTSWKR